MGEKSAWPIVKHQMPSQFLSNASEPQHSTEENCSGTWLGNYYYTSSPRVMTVYLLTVQSYNIPPKITYDPGSKLHMCITMVAVVVSSRFYLVWANW